MTSRLAVHSIRPDMAKLTSMLHDNYGIIVSQIKHPKFEGDRVVPNVSNTLREMDSFAESVEEVIKKGQG